MTIYVSRKNAVVAGLVAEFGISRLHASELANLWEYEASRTGVDQATPGFWETGREVLRRHLADRGVEPSRRPTVMSPAPA